MYYKRILLLTPYTRISIKANYLKQKFRTTPSEPSEFLKEYTHANLLCVVQKGGASFMLKIVAIHSSDSI